MAKDAGGKETVTLLVGNVRNLFVTTSEKQSARQLFYITIERHVTKRTYASK